jgi:hypothetical protein
MYARVVRFTDVSPERIAEIEKRMQEEGGPPPDVPAKNVTVIIDEDQSTAVVTLTFESEEDMRKGDEALNAMDAGETPGTRASIDQGEVKVDRQA